MIVAFANNQTMVGAGDASTVITTDPHPVGDANYVEATFNVHSIFATGGTPDIAYKVQGSNDGQNWFDIGGFSDNTGAATSAPREKGADVTCAFVRVVYTLTASGGSSSDVVGTTFDLHANFIRK